MGISLLLASASESAEHGYGLNFDILDTNIINLAIIIVVLIYFGRGFLGKTLSERRSQIETAIGEAEERKKKAAAALAEKQQLLAQAQTEANRIRANAEENAKLARESILAQAQKDIERLRNAAAQDLTSQQERIIAELRQRVAMLAIQQVEARLKSELNDQAQQQLINRSIAMLGGRS
jgi:F-type H+-transporting ATPase subunit b